MISGARTVFRSRLYAILDVDAIARVAGEVTPLLLGGIAAAAIEAGVQTLQLRAKSASPQQTLAYASALLATNNTWHSEERSDEESAFDFPSASTTILLNDRPDLALLASAGGCHLGQQDISISGARRILPRPKLLGLSTHNEQQLVEAEATDADYLAIGPIFPTASKQNPDPVLGLQELARLRTLTRKPLVAIGGITAANARSVLDCGADAVAVINALLHGADSAASLPAAVARNCADILARIL